MWPGIHVESGAPDQHGLAAATIAFKDLLRDDPKGDKAMGLFEAAVNIWSHAADKGLDIRRVEDERGNIGGPGIESNIGDIRVGVLPFKDRVSGELPPMEQLAHAFQPGTAQAKLVEEHREFWSIGGDIHFRPHKDCHESGVKWVNDPNAPVVGEFDLLTVMIHEVGHALGLGHVPEREDAKSVMNEEYNGPRRVLSVKDIENIRELYGAPKP
jgi:hypothetical protein